LRQASYTSLHHGRRHVHSAELLQLLTLGAPALHLRCTSSPACQAGSASSRCSEVLSFLTRYRLTMLLLLHMTRATTPSSVRTVNQHALNRPRSVLSQQHCPHHSSSPSKSESSSASDSSSSSAEDDRSTTTGLRAAAARGAARARGATSAISDSPADSSPESACVEL
jgi:hypothetical protein